MDSRAQIDIKFRIYGKSYETSFNINYTPEDDDIDIDRRVREWFQNSYFDANFAYREMLAESRRKDEELRERKLLEDLKAKYEGEPIK